MNSSVRFQFRSLITFFVERGFSSKLLKAPAWSSWTLVPSRSVMNFGSIPIERPQPRGQPQSCQPSTDAVSIQRRRTLGRNSAGVWTRTSIRLLIGNKARRIGDDAGRSLRKYLK